jgi:hypothetical protein
MRDHPKQCVTTLFQKQETALVFSVDCRRRASKKRRHALVTALIGLLLFLFGFWRYRKLRASRSWPSTIGTVTGTDVETQTDSGSGGEPASTGYYPVVHYSYWVGQQSYTGHRIGLASRGHQNLRRAQQVLAAWPAGAQVQVYYNPQRPDEAVLQRKDSTGIVFMVLGAVIVVLGMAALAR